MALKVSIRAGEQLEFGSTSCPDLSFIKTSPGGDKSATIAIPFTRGMRLPRGDCPFVIEDDVLGPIWTGFTGPLDPPDLALCTGPVSIGALGGASYLRGKRGEGETRYGPRWTGPVLGRTVEDAVIDAVTRLAPGVSLIDANVVRTGVALQETESFIGQTAADIVGNMMARTQFLATPALYHVRQGLFYWKTMDLAPRYQVLMANGAKVRPKYDPSRAASRIIVGWGKSTEQTATWPVAVSYEKRQQIVDIYLNAGTEINDYATALSIAGGVYARMQLLSPEWSLDISIPSTCPVEELVDGIWTEINPVSVEPGYFLRIPDLDVGSLGPELEVPQGGFMTQMTWQNKTAMLGISVGEPRGAASLTRLARRVVAAGVTPLNIWGYLGRDFSAPRRTAAELLGPQIAVTTTGAAPSGPAASATPAPIAFRVPPVSTEKNQTLITHEAPKPIKIEKGIDLGDEVFTAGLLDTGKYRSDCPPCEIDEWILSGSPSGTISIKVWTAKRNSNGVYPTDGSGDLMTDTLILTATVSGKKLDQHAFTVGANARPRITKPSMLIYEVAASPAPATMTCWVLTMNGNRIVPGHPEGHDTAPALGVTSV